MIDGEDITNLSPEELVKLRKLILQGKTSPKRPFQDEPVVSPSANLNRKLKSADP